MLLTHKKKDGTSLSLLTNNLYRKGESSGCGTVGGLAGPQQFF